MVIDAYEVMREWDRESGIKPRSNEELDRDIPGRLSGNYEEWKKRLEARDIEAIKEGMRIWGLPIAPLQPFAVDERIETAERPFAPEG